MNVTGQLTDFPDISTTANSNIMYHMELSLDTAAGQKMFVNIPYRHLGRLEYPIHCIH